jgi:hypothetical protein
LTRANSARSGGTAIALSAVLACAVIWSALPSFLLSAPHGDNVEQLNWSHALQWGYFKHPPLPTWLLWGAIQIFGPSAALTYAVAMACVAVALLFVWRCACQVLEPRHALIALLVSTANYYLMGRGSFLNHNTVMLPFVALSAWAVLRIVRGGGWPMWLVLGAAQALGLLTKYQMGLVVLANAAALLSAGVHRRPGFVAQVSLASAATVLPLIPHAIWLADHQFSTFEYAGHSLLAGLDTAHRLTACASFLGQQFARLTPALLALAIVLSTAWARRPSFALRATDGKPSPPAPLPHPCLALRASEGEAGARSANAPAQAMRALTVRGLVPICCIVLLVLIAGVAPQNHWGASSTLLIPLLLVSRLRPYARQSIVAAVAATALCHAGAIAWNVTVWRVNPGPHHVFAPRTLAALAQRHWSLHESGPVRLVLGPDWEAGSIALYLQGYPAVVPNADWREAPWIDPDLMSRCGALVIARTGQPLERQLPDSLALSATDWTVLKATDVLGRESAVQAALIAPAPGRNCR